MKMVYFYIAIIALLVFMLGTSAGVLWEAHHNIAAFEGMTGVPYMEFLQSKTDCEQATGEVCRIYGGWAQESLFAE